MARYTYVKVMSNTRKEYLHNIECVLHGICEKYLHVPLSKSEPQAVVVHVHDP